MMEVIVDDFKRTVEVTTDEENQAQQEFNELARANEVSTNAKKSEQTAKEAELGEQNTIIAAEMGDLKAEQEALDKALQELMQLQPACIDTGMTYEERIAKRDQEVASLNEALCILDREGPVKGDEE